MPNYRIYIAVHVKNPPRSSLSFLGWTSSIFLYRGSVWMRLLFLGWTSSIFYQQQLDRSVGHKPPPPSVGHPGLPDLDHIVGIHIKYTHNNNKT
jgi:hypothetical protein